MKSINEYINEGVVDVFKVSMAFTKLQGKVLGEAIELAKNKEYKDAQSLMNDTKPVAQKLYKEYLGKFEGTVSFNDWWKTFVDACGEEVLDEIIEK